ncbi:Rieske 2Fe-2S domain-containing protein [Nocardioides sp. WS12]|uniref:Rieske 2Fe-2S domain-containing protein n=1 Tax=Nocardioides sp. WS12 TaxID=2486272 RepID=UPI0015F87ED2|nr:Rieske 2Fe-2S domain-containing protein [Nocardioides sp. WS12]
MSTETPDGFVELVEADELWDDEMDSYDVGDEEVLLVKVDGQIHAYDAICPHQSISLAEGEFENGLITCRAHEWQFNAVSGEGVNPLGNCLTRHDVRINDDGMVEVRLRESAGTRGPRH